MSTNPSKKVVVRTDSELKGLSENFDIFITAENICSVSSNYGISYDMQYLFSYEILKYTI